MKIGFSLCLNFVFLIIMLYSSFVAQMWIIAQQAALFHSIKGFLNRGWIFHDIENENGGAGKHYILANDEWKEDILPEILDGHNLSSMGMDPSAAMNRIRSHSVPHWIWLCLSFFPCLASEFSLTGAILHLCMLLIYEIFTSLYIFLLLNDLLLLFLLLLDSGS
ncbi:hypothetical protein ACJX0J_036394, partial [Zea mays]